MKGSDIPQPRTSAFGQYLRRVRDRGQLVPGSPERKVKSQMQLADDLVELFGSESADKEKARQNWQSFLARAETGAGTVRPEQLALLAEVYGEPLERMASAYLATHVFLEAPLPKYLEEEPAKRPNWPKSSNFFASNAVEIWSIDQIKQWEREIASAPRPSKGNERAELWIVSPDFLDHKDDDFLRIVVDDLLLNRVNLTYFVAHNDIGPSGKFNRFLDRVKLRLNSRARERGERLIDSNLGTISVYGLTDVERTWFTSSLVIANPSDVQAGNQGVNAFMIVPVEGAHTLGIPVPPNQLSDMIADISFEIERREEAYANNIKDHIFDRDVLRAKLFT